MALFAPSSKLQSLLLHLLALLALLLLSSLFIAVPRAYNRASMSEANAPMVTEMHGVKIERNPPQSKLDELGVASWPKWAGGPSKIPWTFKATETMYLVQGKVKVHVEGYEGSFEIGGGDLLVFPKGMKVVWDVIEAVDKHYSLDSTE